LFNIEELASQVGVGLDITGHLLAGVGDRGRVTPPKLLADLVEL